MSANKTEMNGIHSHVNDNSFLKTPAFLGLVFGEISQVVYFSVVFYMSLGDFAFTRKACIEQSN